MKPTLLSLEAAPAESNRREHRRITVTGVAALVPDGAPAAVWVVRNLSLGGAALQGEAPLIPAQRLRLQMHLAGVNGVEVVDVTAKVLRRQIAALGARCALEFEALSGEQTASLMAALEEQQRPVLLDPTGRVLVVSAARDGARSLVKTLTALGLGCRVVGSAFEGAAWLQRDGAIAAVIIDESLIDSHGWSLTRFMRETHPQVRCLALGGSVPSFRLDMALRAGLVDAVLGRPFRSGELARKLGLTTAEPLSRAQAQRG